jgi:hypothetical protein
MGCGEQINEPVDQRVARFTKAGVRKDLVS